MAIRQVTIGTLEDAVEYDDADGFAMVVDNALNQQVLVSDGSGQFTAGPVSSGGAAPIGASYVVIALDGDLTSERRLQGTANEIALTDGGAGGDITLGFPSSVIINTLTVTNNLAVDTDTLFVNSSTKRVGIGTIIPSALLNLHASAGSDPIQHFSDDDVDHGMTTHYPTNVYGVFDSRDSLGGAFRVTGLNDGGGSFKNGLVLRGFVQLGSSVSDECAVKINGIKKTGTDVGPLGATEIVLGVFSGGGSSLMEIDGNGDMTIVGDLIVSIDVLFVDTTTNRVGINDSTPSFGLDVNGTGRFTGTVTLDSTLSVAGAIAANGAALTSNDATFGLLDITPIKINFGGNAAIDLGKTGLACVFKGTVNVDEAVTFDTTLAVIGITTLTDDLIVDTDTLFVDASANRIGMGTSTPTVRLEVIEASAAGVIVFQGASNPNPIMTIINTAGGGDFLDMIGDAGDPVFTFDSGGGGGEAVLDMFKDNVLNVRLSTRGDSFFIGGDLGVGITNPLAKFHVDQVSSTAAVPVIYLDQADLSEEMIEFNTTIGVGNPIEAIGAKTFTETHFIRITIPGGLSRVIPCGTIA